MGAHGADGQLLQGVRDDRVARRLDVSAARSWRGSSRSTSTGSCRRRPWPRMRRWRRFRAASRGQAMVDEFDRRRRLLVDGLNRLALQHSTSRHLLRLPRRARNRAHLRRVRRPAPARGEGRRRARQRLRALGQGSRPDVLRHRLRQLEEALERIGRSGGAGTAAQPGWTTVKSLPVGEDRPPTRAGADRLAEVTSGPSKPGQCRALRLQQGAVVSGSTATVEVRSMTSTIIVHHDIDLADQEVESLRRLGYQWTQVQRSDRRRLRPVLDPRGTCAAGGGVRRARLRPRGPAGTATVRHGLITGLRRLHPRRAHCASLSSKASTSPASTRSRLAAWCR